MLFEFTPKGEKKKEYLHCAQVNVIVVDVQAMQGAKASAAVLLILKSFSFNTRC